MVQVACPKPTQLGLITVLHDTESSRVDVLAGPYGYDPCCRIVGAGLMKNMSFVSHHL
jgi:hypothetical protein